MNAHEKHLMDQVKYWQRISAEEREKKIYGLEGDKNE